ncbi:MAG: hypothetical protein NUV57_02035 [archaeon]|nr:hypothetical protein [archaeon]
MPWVKTIGLVVIAAVILAGAYFLLFSQSEFESKQMELESIWASKGINISSVDFDEAPEIASLNKDDLGFLKEKISSFESRLGNSADSLALKKLSQIHINILIISEKMLSLAEKVNSFEFNTTNGTTLCQKSLGDFDSITRIGNEIILLSNENNDLIKNYSQQYSATHSIGVSNLRIETTVFETAIVQMQGSRKEFEVLCG